MTATFRLNPTIFATALLTLAACNDSTVEPNPPPPPGPVAIASVTLGPVNATVIRGQTIGLTADIRDAAGRPVTNASITWSSDRQDIATVQADGRVTGVAAGSTEISAVAGGKTGKLTVLVTSQPVGRVDLDSEYLELPEGVSHQINAVARTAEGVPVTGRVTIWTSSAPDVVDVSPLGEVTSLRPGNATISARVDGVTATATVKAVAFYEYDLAVTRTLTLGEYPQLVVADPNDPTHALAPAGALPVSGIDPAGSPDGRKIAYAAQDEYGRTDIYVLSRGGPSVRVTSGPALDDHPTWSPDGNRIAFRRRILGPNGQTSAAQIWVMNADGTGLTELTADQTGSSKSAPAWSPTRIGGSRIAYVATVAGLGQIWTMRPDGSDKRQVTGTATTSDDEPAWSPDGANLAFSRLGNIWIVNAAGGSERLLVDLPLNQFAPAWSPDGQLIAFTSNHAGGVTEVYTARTTGAIRVARRTFDGSYKSTPTWLVR